MGVNMGEVFRQKFPIKPEDIITPSPQKSKQILDELTRNLARSQEEFEKNDRRIIYRSFK